jgi:hypothetical protein
MKLKNIIFFGVNTGAMFFSFMAKGMDSNFVTLDSWTFNQEGATANKPAESAQTQQTQQKTAATTTGQTSTELTSANSSKMMPNNYFIPHVYLNGYAGGNDDSDFNAIGRLDILAPVYLRTDRNLFLYGQGNIASAQDSWQNTSYSGSLGLGYRQIVNAENNDTTTSGRILGAYLLVDENHTADGHNFGDISPGIETLGERWDARINGYIPIGTKEWDTEYWAHDLGDWSNYDQDSTPHTITDTQYVYHEEVGMGGDAEVGAKLFSVKRMPVKAYLDGYYFHMDDHDNMTGIGGRLTFQPTPYLTLEARYTYDNYQMNQFLAGIRINLNELDKFSQAGVDDANMQMRLFDQIERNVATQITGTTAPEVGGPDKSSPDDYNDDVVVSENNWYFADSSTSTSDASVTTASSATESSSSSSGDGTHANPYSSDDFNQAYIDQIYNETVASGDYSFMSIHLQSGNNAYVISASNGGDPVLDLPENTYIYGEDENFQQSEHVIIEGGMTLSNGDNLNYLQFYNDPNYQLDNALTVNTGASVILNNVIIGSADSDGNPIGDANGYYYNTGLIMDNANVIINDSSIYAYNKDNAASTSGEVEATGIYMTNVSTLVVNNSQVKATAIELNTTVSSSGIAYGIHADGVSSTDGIGDNILIENDSVINGTGEGGDNNSGIGYGILVGQNYYVMTTSDTVDAISGHIVTVNSGSNVSGIGKDAVGTESSNGYGIVIGYGYAAIENASDSSVVNTYNTVNISGEDTVVSGSGDGINSSSGNGFGVVIGYGYGEVINSADDEEYVNGNSMTLWHDTLNITDNSTVSGTGNMSNTASSTPYTYAGRGIGAVVGFGQQEVAVSGEADSSDKPTDTNFTIGYITVLVEDSTINSVSANLGERETMPTDGNNESELALTNVGYGLLVGYGGSFNSDSNTSNYGGVEDANVDIENSTIYTYIGEGGGMSAAAGIEVGNYGDANGDDDNSNTVTAQNNLFESYVYDESYTDGGSSQIFGTDSQYSVGLYMPENSGTLNWKNSDGEDTNVEEKYGFYFLQTDLQYGLGIKGPGGEEDLEPWVNVGTNPPAQYDPLMDLMGLYDADDLLAN